jgi:AcrR family transcriptional regulator
MQSQPAATRRRQRQSQARQIILDAARQLLLDDGIEGFTMRRLAQRCGYTAPTIYHYFGDKQGLLDVLLEQEFRRLLAELERVPTVRDPLEALRALFHVIVRFGLDNPKHYRLLHTARPENAGPLPSDEAARRRVEAPLEQLFRAGRLRADELEPVRQALWALLHGLISLQNSRPDVEWATELAELGLESMLLGLLRPSLGREGAA